MTDIKLTPNQRALVVLSGGQDSTTCLYDAMSRFAEVHAVTFDYGQRHSAELEAAHRIAQRAGVADRHEVIRLGPILAGRSPLTSGEPLETYTDFDQMDKTIGDRIELTFVPMRNALFLTLAINRAICKDILNLVTGVCQADNANYPDCRETFILSQTDTANKALGLDMRLPQDRLYIDTPLMDRTKPESVLHALALPGCYAALAFSHTAYSGEYPPVTQDHATVLRAWGFEKAGVPDPLIVRAYWEGLLPALPATDNYMRFIKLIEGRLPKMEAKADYSPFLDEWLDQLETILRHTILGKVSDDE